VFLFVSSSVWKFSEIAVFVALNSIASAKPAKNTNSVCMVFSIAFLLSYFVFIHVFFSSFIVLCQGL